MNDQEMKRIEGIALFRYGVLGDLVHLKPGERPGDKRLSEVLREKADKTYCIPFSRRVHVAEETMRGWLKDYRKAGFDGLKPRPRADAGESRTIPQDIADLLLSIKEESPDLSVRLVIAKACAAKTFPEDLLKSSTVHRLLSRKGLMERDDAPGEKDRRRFAFLKAGQLWMSDVMHGPSVLDGRRKRKAFLIALLDDATRVVPCAAFAFSENTAAFLAVFKQALLRRGVPERLFVDNGAAYRSLHLSLVCAKIGTTLIHARPYRPQGKGKIERFFRTVRLQLLPQLCAEDLSTLEALNRKLWAYIETEYHLAPHRGLDQDTPLDRWAKVADEVRYLNDDLDDLFLAEAKRKVGRDRVVSLHGVAYEVEASLVNTTVLLRYDPALPKRPIQVVANGQTYRARVVDTYANCFVKRERPSRCLTPIATAETGVSADPPPVSAIRMTDLAENLSQKEDR